MTEKTYRAIKAVNKSTLWEMRKSAAHYKYNMEHPREDTEALKLGRAVHTAILRPRSFSKEFAVFPADIDKRTKVGRAQFEAFTKESAGKDIISSADMEMIDQMKRAVHKNDAAMELLKGTKKEMALFWNDENTSMRCKCRCDAVKEGICIDLKTAKDASTGAFLREAMNRGYDVQAAHYIRGLKAKYGWSSVDFAFIVVEKEAPFAVNVLRCDDSFIDRGTWQLIELMDKLKKCRDTGKWESYGVNELIVPAWAAFGSDD